LRKEQASISPVSIPHCTRRAVKHRLVVIWTRSLVVSPKYLLPFRKNAVAEFECLTNIGILAVSRKGSVSGLFACSRKCATATHETVAPKNHMSVFVFASTLWHFRSVMLPLLSLTYAKDRYAVRIACDKRYETVQCPSVLLLCRSTAAADAGGFVAKVGRGEQKSILSCCCAFWSDCKAVQHTCYTVWRGASSYTV